MVHNIVLDLPMGWVKSLTIKDAPLGSRLVDDDIPDIICTINSQNYTLDFEDVCRDIWDIFSRDRDMNRYKFIHRLVSAANKILMIETETIPDTPQWHSFHIQRCRDGSIILESDTPFQTTPIFIWK